MRELKFKGWINKLSCWADNLIISSDGGFTLYKDEVPYFNGEIVQFTGLKDKNGREIYEGDILRSHSGITGPVEWDSCSPPGFVWTHHELVNLDMEGGKVIGNIYEPADSGEK